MESAKTSKKIKILNGICALVLIIALLYLIAGGIELAAYGLMAAAIIGIAIPVVIAGEGFLGIIWGILEAVWEGVIAVVEAILGIVSGIFN